MLVEDLVLMLDEYPDDYDVRVQTVKTGLSYIEYEVVAVSDVNQVDTICIVVE